MDLREYFNDPEEALRTAVAGLLKQVWTAMPASVSVDSQDGHVATAQPMIKRQVTNPDGSITYEDHTDHPDLPIHHLGGGPVVTTHPTVKGDTGAILYMSRAIDSWFNSGGSQNPMEDRAHSLADGVFLSGIRSTPDKLQQVSQTSTQTRTVDKRSVIDHGPNGTHHKTVDPSTAAASAEFDPFSQATTFFEHILHPSNGHAVNATDGGTTHSTSMTHTDGFKAAANNGAHSLSAHPTNGTSILSSVAHTLQAPNASLDKSGNQTNRGSSTSQGNITSSSGNVSAPSGAISGQSGSFGSLTGIGGAVMALIKAAAGSFSSIATGSMQSTGPVAAPTIQTNQPYTVATLPTPSLLLQGTRAFVTDATSPSFMQALVGGGIIVCPAFCDGTQWVAG
ncbi:Gp138 family membrane-puncturing spike protein [Beijerinckia sp. L45]|uniref:Gp138 family membrane-puncturing spike protein n=1 Tax=Beijerinckia sp. L45 TaxID=1641855 RepID=UPI00131D2A41|nr:Gp138 family membrane-puncturing spike protein [Beijerinckia sp. L45]